MLTYFLSISLIANCLTLYGIPHTIQRLYGGWQLVFPWTKGDVICHEYSIGAAKGYVETYCFPWDRGDVSSLSPDEAVEKLVTYYLKLKEKED